MFVIRGAHPGEAPTLSQLQLRSSLVWEETRSELQAQPHLASVPAEQIQAGQVRVLMVDDAVVGFSSLVPVGDGCFELDGLFVEPEAMRGGCGRALVDDCIASAGRADGVAVEVTANPRALGFYERCGFVAIGQEATLFGPGIRMRLAIPRGDPED